MVYSSSFRARRLTASRCWWLTLWLGLALSCLLTPLRAQPESKPIDLSAPQPTPKAEPGKKTEEEPDIELSAEFGYCDYQPAVKTNQWYPLWITIKPLHSDLKGVISCQQPDNPSIMRIPLEAAKQTTKRLLTYYRLREGLVPSIEISVDARPLKSREMLPLPLRYARPSEHQILVFSPDQGSFSFLKRQTEDNANSEEDSRTPQITVLEGKIDQLPPQALALEGIDSIIINTPEIRALSVDQWKALNQWVELGGGLLIGTGELQPFLAQSVVQLPPGLAAAEPRAGSPAPGAPDMLISALTGSWDAIHAGGKDSPLLASRRVGAGLFSLASVSLSRNALDYLNKPPDAWRIWQALLLRDGAHALTTELNGPTQDYIPIQLQIPFTVNLAGVGWVITYLGLYVLLALPINWLFWIAVKRREWAWPTMIVIALAFAWYGYHSGLESQAKGLHIHELSIVRRPHASSSAYYESYSTVFADRRTRTPLTADPGVFPSNLESNLDSSRYGREPEMYATSPLEIHFGPSVDLDNFFIYAFSARNLRSEGVIQPVGAVEWSAPGVIRNGVGWRFLRWAVVRENRASALNNPPLEPDAKQPVGEMQPAAADVPSMILKDALLDFRQGISMTQDQAQNLARRGSWQSTNIEPDAQLNQNVGSSYFIGVAEVAVSPLLDNLHVARRINRVIYIQGIGPDTAAASPAPPAGALHVDRGPGPAPSPSKNPDALTFWPRPTLVRVTPPLRPGGPIPASMTLTLKIENSPDASKRFKDYQIIGCPAQVYNCRTGKTEETTLYQSDRIVLSPLIDYIDPDDSSIRVWLDGTPKSLKLQHDGAGQIDEPVAGTTLWPDGPNNPAPPLYYGNGPQPYAANGNESPRQLEISSYDFSFDPSAK